MRVIAGRYGGRRLVTPAGAGTRPTAERVREALFSSLGALDGESVLDLFAGSGALGLEALSRGAHRAVFVERDDRALAALRANVAALKLSGEQATIRGQDARGALRAARTRGETYDLVFLDPPYRHGTGFAGMLADSLTDVLCDGARVVCESDRRAPLALTIPRQYERCYGDTLITIHLHTACARPER